MHDNLKLKKNRNKNAAGKEGGHMTKNPKNSRTKPESERNFGIQLVSESDHNRK